MIRVENIVKNYGTVKALSNISFQVNEGELFGLIGPDGAGKTSLLRILTTLLLPASGDAYMNGYHTLRDYKQIRKELGYMPGRFSLYPDLTVEENLRFFATVFGTSIEENYDLIKDIYIQIEPFKKRKAGKLSGGMKQKLALSCALIHKPVILVLDEPTTGVDAVSRKEFWEMLKRLKQKGITIIVSTPYMDEAEMCDRIALIQKGTIMQINTPENILQELNETVYSIRAGKKYKVLQALHNHPFSHSAYLFGDDIHFISKPTPNAESKVFDYLQNNFEGSIEVAPIKPTIEDCFMELMTKTQNHESI